MARQEITRCQPHWLSLSSPVIPALLECHLQHRVGGTVGLFPLAVDPDRVLGRQAERRLGLLR